MKRWAPKLFLAILGLVAACLAVEIGMRVTGLGGVPTLMRSMDRSRVFYEASPSRRHPLTGSCPDPLRIAVIGDSFTAGHSVQWDDRYAARLERMLNANDGVKPAEVDVFAKPATSTFQQLRLLNLALEQKPGVVVLGVCLNDPENWARPKRLVEWRQEMIAQPPPPLLRRSRFLSFAYWKWQQTKARRGYIRYYQRLYDPEYSGWNRFAYSLEVFRDRCRQGGARLLVLIIPLMSEDFDRGRYPFESFHDQIRDALQERGVEYLDLLDRFRGKDPVRMQAIPGVDPHPNEIAHRIIAEAICDYLVTNAWIASEYQPRMSSMDPVLRRNWNRALKSMGGSM